jgi:tetratricopeptide (TPR) repeat protein
MSNKRPAILMAVLLLLVLGYVWYPHLDLSKPPPPLPGANSVSNLVVSRDADGRWFADYDYFFTGEPAGAHLQTYLSTEEMKETRVWHGYVPAERGDHHVHKQIERPSTTNQASVTKSVTIQIRSYQAALAQRDVERTIEWPDARTWELNRQIVGQPPDKILAKAVALIDGGRDYELDEARELLQGLTTRDPRFDGAYVELARVAMKSNWGPDGLHQAESLLDSALQIRPDNVNAKILLAYVYVHQRRDKLALPILEEVSKSDPPNLWLWSTWGELLTMQHKPEAAIEKYRASIGHPPTRDTYDRARMDAYEHLLALQEQRKDLDGMDATYRQRVADYGVTGCFGTRYAHFLLQQRGDYEGAMAMARRSIDASCTDVGAREILGLAYYIRWCDDKGPGAMESLNQARVFLPPGPKALYLLASGERTVPAARKLIAGGEAVDQRDNLGLDALAYALHQKDFTVAKRLLKLGARPETPIGPDDMPVAFLPVIESDLDGVRLMRQSGVDYATLRFRGMSALDQAKATGDRRMIELLASHSERI